ncbi:hypothetical protein LX97_00979 [Nonlabens dokdonensis]|uniref:Hemagluttinin family protein n=2 Tax=Nonlabens dokdonensis TaxID=328515 RepID=L7W7Z2_NONDD|nr:hemagglutinin family protein [Nonlabens dokdonensis]AGC76312.1 hemagluttinin family protein [Nonlabens dokdonensis DSW-6]PZX43974.1 hypothetical protein LX97_00979 [Nonlabens dokdonensis]
MRQITFLTVFFLLLFTSITSLSAQTLNESSGTGAHINITSGDYNTAFGDSAGFSLTSGSQTTFLGYQAGRSNTTSEFIAIGYQAGYSNTTGFDNLFIGWQAGFSNLTGGDNIFIGSESGEFNTTGYDNTFVGEESGSRNTTGYENVFIGEDAGFSNTTGYRNVFVGNEAGFDSDTGFRNTGVGDEALSDVDNGQRNSAFGESAGIDIGDGNFNTMLGSSAGVATEWADANTFVGASAGWDNNRTNSTSNANKNTYVGAGTGSSNREGEENVGMGAFASFGSSGYSGFEALNSLFAEDNDLITGNRTNTSRTTFIGANADAGNNDVTLVGYSTRVDGQYGVAMGTNTDVLSTGSIGLGYNTTIASGSNNSVGIGREVDIDNQETVAIGSNTVAQANGGIAIGHQATVDITGNPTVFTGNNMAIGYEASATNHNSIAIGATSSASGENAMAIGQAATAPNDNTLVLGGATNPVSVGIGTDTPSAFASMELSGNNKGLLVNRLTDTEITALESNLTAAQKGLVLYDSNNDVFQVWDGTQWLSAINTDDQELSLNGSNLGITNSSNTVDLSTINTDNQALSLNNNMLSITNDSNPVDLSPLTADLETRVAALENATGSASSGDMTPLLFNYQSVIRDTDGNPIKNDAVDVRIAVREDGVTGTVVYNEEHSLTSSEYGVLSLQVGGGTLLNGDFSTINWGEHEYYLEISLDTAQTGTFTTLSTTQLLSVPYALHARSADFITGTTGSTGSRAAKSSADLKIESLENKLKMLEAKMQKILEIKN